MYEFLEGVPILYSDCIIIEIHGIGYRILTPPNVQVLANKNPNKLRVYISQVIKEDAITLYGFSGYDERELFNRLKEVSGIGPKTALNILSFFTPTEFMSAIEQKDAKGLAKVPGLGKKTAERLIIDIRGYEIPFLDKKDQKTIPSNASDALNALIQLGYPRNQARAAIEKAAKETDASANLSELIAKALQCVREP